MNVKTVQKVEIMAYSPDVLSMIKDYAVRGKVVQRYVASPWHDKDITAEGSPKKVHQHIVVSFKYPLKVDDICKKFDVNLNQLCYIKGTEEDAVRYQTHEYVDPKANKHVYERTDIQTNDPAFVEWAFSDEYAEQAKEQRLADKEQRDECAEALNIISHIQANPTHSYTKLAQTFAEQGLWSTYRRGYSIFSQVIKENRGIVDDINHKKLELIHEKKCKLRDLSRDTNGVYTKDDEIAILRWYEVSVDECIDDLLTGTSTLKPDDIFNEVFNDNVHKR